jgi:hypothetical protein
MPLRYKYIDLQLTWAHVRERTSEIDYNYATDSAGPTLKNLTDCQGPYCLTKQAFIEAFYEIIVKYNLGEYTDVIYLHPKSKDLWIR